MSYRVIAGKAKGKRLQLVPGDSTRPIMDRAKEALFNIIGPDIYDTVFLDLFAGTGAVGIEALSRGAHKAVFFDTTPVALKTIHENLEATRLRDQAQVHRADAFKIISGQPREEYDFIYIAPPQYKGMWRKALEILDGNPVWIPYGTSVIVQIDPKEQEPITLQNMETVDERKYGKTLLWFLKSTYEEETA
ncbi:MAG: 16S rRNA (guanine(966)-N(2))-methyltransferase RsmD [Chloroflexota bacterium]